MFPGGPMAAPAFMFAMGIGMVYRGRSSGMWDCSWRITGVINGYLHYGIMEARMEQSESREQDRQQGRTKQRREEEL